MKIANRLLSILLVCCMLLGFNIVDASAEDTLVLPTNNAFYYIQHVGSGKYLDITDESTENGARLQIWEKAANHQNQVFKLTKVGSYWKIIPWNSKKVLEVRDSRQDDGAPVAQWDYCGIDCQLWKITKNTSKGCIFFKNKNSGKYLDVPNNYSYNGNKLIQYTRNLSEAQQFRLRRLYNEDVLNACWTRKFKTSDISWTQVNLNNPVANYTSFSSNKGYPTPNKKYLKKIEYIDPETTFNMIVQKSLDKSKLQKIKELVAGELTEEAAGYLLKEMGYEIPFLGIAIGVLEVLATSGTSEWNKFAKTAKSGYGIKKTTYVKIMKYSTYGPLNNGTTAWGNNYYVTEAYSYSYSLWKGTGSIKEPNYSGGWTFNFK